MSRGEQILKALKTVGPRLERAIRTRAELQDQWDALILEGDAEGLKATEMARARKPDEDITHLAEYMRQQIRKQRVSTETPRLARNQKK